MSTDSDADSDGLKDAEDPDHERGQDDSESS